MRRNVDILRDIMLAAERHPAGKSMTGSDLKASCGDPQELGDHVQQLLDAGFLDGVVHFTRGQNPKIVIKRVKNPGHDFLQLVRQDAIWNELKETVMRLDASWTLETVIEQAKRRSGGRPKPPATPPRNSDT
jgi:hypothetical protein